jgi:hypothetical protein
MGERYGFGPWDIAKMHPREIKLYATGAEERETKKQRQASTNRQTPVTNDQRRREREAMEKLH